MEGNGSIEGKPLMETGFEADRHPVIRQPTN
jgi:hypothetical protein